MHANSFVAKIVFGLLFIKLFQLSIGNTLLFCSMSRADTNSVSRRNSRIPNLWQGVRHACSYPSMVHMRSIKNYRKSEALKNIYVTGGMDPSGGMD